MPRVASPCPRGISATVLLRRKADSGDRVPLRGSYDFSPFCCPCKSRSPTRAPDGPPVPQPTAFLWFRPAGTAPAGQPPCPCASRGRPGAPAEQTRTAPCAPRNAWCGRGSGRCRQGLYGSVPEHGPRGRGPASRREQLSSPHHPRALLGSPREEEPPARTFLPTAEPPAPP